MYRSPPPTAIQKKHLHSSCCTFVVIKPMYFKFQTVPTARGNVTSKQHYEQYNSVQITLVPKYVQGKPLSTLNTIYNSTWQAARALRDALHTICDTKFVVPTSGPRPAVTRTHARTSSCTNCSQHRGLPSFRTISRYKEQRTPLTRWWILGTESAFVTDTIFCGRARHYDQSTGKQTKRIHIVTAIHCGSLQARWSL